MIDARSARRLAAVGAIAGGLGLAGCAGPMPAGILYYNASLPATGASEVTPTKKGEAMCTSILSMVAMGDCSIDAAKSNGGIKRVAFVDWQVENILGVYGKYTTIVYGD